MSSRSVTSWRRFNLLWTTIQLNTSDVFSVGILIFFSVADVQEIYMCISLCDYSSRLHSALLATFIHIQGLVWQPTPTMRSWGFAFNVLFIEYFRTHTMRVYSCVYAYVRDSMDEWRAYSRLFFHRCTTYICIPVYVRHIRQAWYVLSLATE